MAKETISKKILQKIKEENIKPKPKWEFLLKDCVFWGAFAMSILIGGLVTSVAIFRISTNDWDIAEKLGHHPFNFALRTFPYFWLIILAIFIFIAYYNFEHTKKGYKVGISFAVMAGVVLSIALGCAFLAAGLARVMDEQALKHLPFYRNYNLDDRVEMWSQIDKGLIAGEIIEIIPNGLIIEGFDGKKWTIDTSAVPKELLMNLKREMIIGIIGEKISDEIFNAIDIRPWKGNFMKPHMKPHMLNFMPMKEKRIFMRTI